MPQLQQSLRWLQLVPLGLGSTASTKQKKNLRNPNSKNPQEALADRPNKKSGTRSPVKSRTRCMKIPRICYLKKKNRNNLQKFRFLNL